MSSMDELMDRMHTHFRGPYLKGHQECTVTITDKKTSTKTSKVVNIVIISNVNEGYKHYAIVAPELSAEWEYFSKGGLINLINEFEKDVYVAWSDADGENSDTLSESTFSKKVYIFTDKSLVKKGEVVSGFKIHGFKPVFIDDSRWGKIMDNKKPDFFIIHDSRDKDVFARPLYESLAKKFYKVWYDEYSLSVGDDLCASIDQGLSKCSHAIIIISKNFLENDGWASKEISALLNRSISEKENNLVLPVWLNVDRNDVAGRSAILANIVALQASEGIEKVADKLAKVAA